MTKLNIYFIIHFIGIFLLISSISVMCFYAIKGEKKSEWVKRKLLMILHGIGSFLVLLGGQGLIAGYQGAYSNSDSWIIGKFAIWFVLSAAPLWLAKSKIVATISYIVLLVLVVIAAYLAKFKGF